MVQIRTMTQRNTQFEPSTNNPHIMPSSTGQNNIVNQISNMSLGDQQRPPSANFPLPPLPGKSTPPMSTPSNVNRFNNVQDVLPGAVGPIGQTDPGGNPMSSISGQDLQQKAISKNPSTFQSGFPFSGHPMDSNLGQYYPGQRNVVDPSPGQPSFPRPPPTGQKSTPPLPGQPNLPNLPMQGQPSLSNSPLPRQQNLSNPAMPYQPHLSGPPLPGQQTQNNATPYGVHGQQNLPAPPPPLSKQNLSAMSNLPAPPGPPLPGQQYPPPMQGQQNFNRQPYMGQPNLPEPQAQPPLPGQPIGQMMNAAPNLPPSGQRQYTSAPPMQGQTMGAPVGPNRFTPGGMAGYQPVGYQGYNNDMYNAQRVSYHGGTPGPGVGYQQGDAQTQQVKRLDPDHMPSPIQVIEDDQHVKGGVFVTNQNGLVPPLVTTKFVTQDQGNASPRYIRSTMYTVPTTADILKQTNVPFALIISPMARIEEGEYEPPIVDMGEMGPVRCVRCKAYMSPFMQFIDAGRRFQCMFCKATTGVPEEYFQHLDHTGQRMDRYERPELMLGTYEFLATKEYCKNDTFPKPPAIVFVIDVSYNTVKSGLVNLLCAKMKSILRNLPVDVGQSKSNMKVGFITYNNTVHFYNVNSCLAQPQMMVVGDVQDVFMPLLDGFLCDVEESEAVIDSLMTQIPAMFADTRETEIILAPAIQAGLEALKASDRVGKLLVFHSSLPIAEAPGKLKNRDDRKVLGTEKEKTVLAPQNNVYNNLGQDCEGAGCSVDLFVFNNSYVDIATISQVARLTGGEVYKYTYFQADIDGDRLIADVINNISRPIAFNATMRVRTSTGVRATDFFGHFYMSNTTEMELASIDCNKAIAVEVKHDDKLTEDEGVYIQAALLYTSCSGIRRLRIINLSLKTSSELAELYRVCDQDAIINFFAKQSVFKLIESSPKTVKDNLIARSSCMLAAYRKHCASPSSAGQLILPECMKLLPLYTNALLRTDALAGGADMTIDDRAFVMQAVATMPISISVAYIYPRLFSLHNVDPQDTELPQMLRCSINKFSEDGAYLLENSIHMFLWLGLGLSPQWVQAVFGVPSVVQVDTDRTSLPILDTPLNKRITDIIDRMRMERHRCMRLTIVRQRDKLEMVLRHFLIEDRGNDGGPSYVDFLCHMHKEIRTLLSQ